MKSLKTYIKEEEENFQIKLINDLCGSVGSGTKAAGVYESWVHIVSSFSGGTRPNRTQIDKAREHGEFHPEGEKWLQKVEKKTAKIKKEKGEEKEEEYWDMVCEAIDYIGGDIKDSAMPKSIKWGKVNIIHKNIGPQYYKKIQPHFKTPKTKENTADIIIITKGTAADLGAALLNCTEKDDIKWDDKGLCSIPAVKGIEWYQISLKKGIDDARIGKLTTWLKGKFVEVVTDVTKLEIQPPKTNEVMQRGNYLGVSYGFDDRIDQILLDEGLFDVFKSIKDKVVGGFKKFVNWAKKKLRKLVGRIFKLANKVMKSNPVLDNANEILKIAGVSARTLSEEYLEEKESTVVTFDRDSDRKRLLDKMIIFEQQLFSHSVNAEYKKLMKTAGKLDDKKRQAYKDQKKPAVLFKSSMAEAELAESDFATLAKEIIEKLKNPDKKLNEKGKITTAVRTGDLFLPLKVASHYTAYNAINVILEKIGENMTKEEGHAPLMNAAMHFVADSKAEAKFGNTELPLWIVYGQRGKAHYMGRKQEFKDLEFDRLIDNPHALAVDQPFIVIRIVKAKKTKSTYNLGGHNVTELYLMSGFQDEKDKPPLPIYMLMNFTTSSGSSFTMKVEVEKEFAKSWI
jgi:hypothetical protein